MNCDDFLVRIVLLAGRSQGALDELGGVIGRDNDRDQREFSGPSVVESGHDCPSFPPAMSLRQLARNRS